MPLRVLGPVTCPHCQVVVLRAAGSWKTVGSDPNGDYVLVLEAFACPHCDEPIIAMLKGQATAFAPGAGRDAPVSMNDETERWVVYPRSYHRPVAPGVPDDLAEDYREAAMVLNMSPKASAALSRRCLQNTIREVAHISKDRLLDEISELIAAGMVTSALASELDAVRHIGNFAAHPTKDVQTGVMVEVEPGEAEWTLDLLDRLFDELIVQPARSTARKTALNAKLRAAGKPEIP